jgi:DNA mismatch repair ATPase MutS
VNREVHSHYTKGTFRETALGGDSNLEQNYEPNFVMSIRIEHNNEVGISFFDISTSKCFIGRFVDDNNFAGFRTLIS